MGKVFVLTSEGTAPAMQASKLGHPPELVRTCGLEHLVNLHKESGTIPYEATKRLHQETCRLFRKIAGGQLLDLGALENTLSEAVNCLITSGSRMPKLRDFVYFDETLPAHSINVALTALFTGAGLGFDRERLMKLASGGLLHDAGLVDAGSRSVAARRSHVDGINPSPARTHPGKGAAFLRAGGLRDEAILTMVYNHHERHDGLGYPHGIGENEITLDSAIVAVSERFVTQSNPMESGGLQPGNRAIKGLLRDAGRAHSPQAVRALVGAVGLYSIGSLVKLTSGETGMVVENSDDSPLAPRLMLMDNSDGEEFAEPTYMDLSENKGVHVEQVVDPSDWAGLGLISI
jgi:HD-GYP domain-containing protein (c-di-GMP phosphodiesterase class II)